MNLVVDRRTRLAKFFDRADFVGLGTMLLLALGIVAVGAGWVNGDAARLVVIALGAVLVGIIAMAVMGNGEVRRKLAPYGLLKPGILWLALFFLAPVWSLFVMSLSAKESRFDFWPDFSWHWDNYRTALTEFRPQFVRSFSYAVCDRISRRPLQNHPARFGGGAVFHLVSDSYSRLAKPACRFWANRFDH